MAIDFDFIDKEIVQRYNDVCFLYTGISPNRANISSSDPSISNHHFTNASYLSYGKDKSYCPKTFSEFPLGKNLFGYISYEFRTSDSALFSSLGKHFRQHCNLPLCYFSTYKQNCVFKDSNLIGKSRNNFEQHSLLKYSPSNVKWITSSLTKNQHIAGVKKIREHIINGDIFQANLTNKFYGEFIETPNPFEIFQRLNQINPVQYSSFFKFDNKFIISFSPELFLKISPSGHIVSSPIKGSSDSTAIGSSLQDSLKDRAENLMIVDLTRNDLGKIAMRNTVRASHIPRLEKYNTIQHLTSDVHAKKAVGVNDLDVISACFPPGSMTGAPKVKAVEIISNLENSWQRGVYSGCLGNINTNQGDESSTLSVVIRTLVIDGNKFEFQVGGGIVYDSDPELEYLEIMTKATPIVRALNLQNHSLFKPYITT